ncbi:Riboflavin synthase eubacterial/eukaryotic [hydrothermal vent metagenome]|uniref:Riboflavin synthase n=1 Tax=hydrothermal vent metagenome TaxID=652676 RepID=A0A3B1CBX4_9ZZZZ
MFTGIIEGIGVISAIRHGGGDISIDVDTGDAVIDPAIGESVALDGVCLTVVNAKGPILSFDISVETIARSNFKKVKVGTRLNLERAMRMGDRLGGHMVSGHVDCLGLIKKALPSGEGYEVEIELPEEGMKYVIEKGSISISGISLTVAKKLATGITIAVIPHTWEVTSLGGLSPGSPVNIEYDMIGKYVENFIQAFNTSGGSITKEFLKDNGF